MLDNKAIELLAANKVDGPVVDPETGETVGLAMNFETEEARGHVFFERSSYGAYVWVNGKPLFLVDLYFYSKTGDFEQSPKCPQVLFYPLVGADDPLGYVRWRNDNLVEVQVEARRMEYGRSAERDHLLTQIPEEDDDASQSEV